MNTKLDSTRVFNHNTFNRYDKYVILNLSTNMYIEGHCTLKASECARDVLNDHEERNGRPRCYIIEEI